MFLKLVLAGILAAGMGFAQRGGGGMGGDEGGGGGGRGMDLPSVPRVTARIDTIGDMLKLNKEQKKSVKTILDEAQKQANPVREQILKSRMAVGDAVQNGKGQEELKTLVGNQAALETQMTRIELDAFVNIYKSLQQEQRSQTRPLFMMMKGMFETKNWNYPQ